MAEIEHYKHKYLSVFKSEAEYEAEEGNFEEVNYSAIIPDGQTDETRKDYYPSTRTTNKDNEYVMRYWTDDVLKTKFFLEIVWGYFGWEWHDYEHDGETLTGGNLYKVKETEAVKSIIDGLRLQHINNFLNSQDKIKTVNSFDTGNIIAANKAFMRIGCTKFNTRTYYNDYVPLAMTLCVKEWPKLEEADYFFAGNDPVMENGDTLEMPLVTSLKGMYMGGTPNSVVKLEAPKLTAFDEGFKMTTWNRGTVSLNEYFSELPKGLKSIRELMRMAHFLATKSDEELECEVGLDLTGVSLGSDDVIDATEAFAWMRNQYGNSLGQRWNLVISLLSSHKIDLTGAFKGICDKTSRNVTFTDTDGSEKYISFYNNKGFETMDLGSVFAESRLQYITSIANGMQYNIFSDLPLKKLPNTECDDTEVYDSCTITTAEYDFSPEKVVVNGKGQFNNCTIEGTFSFSNMDCLSTVEMKNVKLTTPCELPNILCNDSYTYNEDYGKYRYISLEGSDFTGIAAQDIYLLPTLGTLRDDGSYSEVTYYNPISKCKNWVGSKDVHFHWMDAIGGKVGGDFDFTGNTSLKETPTMHLESSRVDGISLGPSLRCQDCTTIEEINFDYVHITHCYSQYHIFCSGCTNLKYFRYGTGLANTDNKTRTLDLTGCKNLDTDTLSASLLTFDEIGSLSLPVVVWNALPEATQEHCVTIGTVNIVTDEIS